MHLQKIVREERTGRLEQIFTPLMSITGLSSEVSCTLRKNKVRRCNKQGRTKMTLRAMERGEQCHSAKADLDQKSWGVAVLGLM
jgi:hypothetical protein